MKACDTKLGMRVHLHVYVYHLHVYVYHLYVYVYTFDHIKYRAPSKTTYVPYKKWLALERLYLLMMVIMALGYLIVMHVDAATRVVT